MREPIYCREGISYLLIVLGLTVIGLYFVTILGIVGIILTLFILWFFRNPTRSFDTDPETLISPADGTVVAITDVEDSFIGEPAQKITIFLSVFNVHVNRTPASGVVKYHHYHEGKFLPAYKPHAALENERSTIGVEMADGYRYKVRQITGILARRIVCDVQEGQTIVKGSRFGMIKFGSCTELVIPKSTQVLVEPGMKIRGNATIIARKGR